MNRGGVEALSLKRLAHIVRLVDGYPGLNRPGWMLLGTLPYSSQTCCIVAGPPILSTGNLQGVLGPVCPNSKPCRISHGVLNLDNLSMNSQQKRTSSTRSTCRSCFYSLRWFFYPTSTLCYRQLRGRLRVAEVSPPATLVFALAQDE